jgi:hypothetical protein
MSGSFFVISAYIAFIFVSIYPDIMQLRLLGGFFILCGFMIVLISLLLKITDEISDDVTPAIKRLFKR